MRACVYARAYTLVNAHTCLFSQSLTHANWPPNIHAEVAVFLVVFFFDDGNGGDSGDGTEYDDDGDVGSFVGQVHKYITITFSYGWSFAFSKIGQCRYFKIRLCARSLAVMSRSKRESIAKR